MRSSRSDVVEADNVISIREGLKNNRGIAQSGSAPALGAGCREFESLYPDQFQASSVASISYAPVAQSDRAPAF
jgi:hypothetical protein